MSLLGFAARNHPQQDAQAAVDDRATDPQFFAQLDMTYRFTVDVAASAHNTKCVRYFDVEANGLEQSWSGESVWCNPPFSRLRPWVEKAWRECDVAERIVMLLPANRTEQSFWQELVEPYRDAGNGLTTRFVNGRLRFAAAGRSHIGSNERPPFGCVLLVWEPPVLCRPVLGAEQVRLA